jgi:signal transduction histidine kinase
MPALTLRARLTLLFALIFAVGGLIVVAISFALVANAPAVSDASAKAAAANSSLARTCKLAEQSGNVDPNLAVKCKITFQRAVTLGAKTQRENTVAKLPLYALITVGAATALATLAGWLLAGRMLRPLAKITDAAQRASQTNLSHRLTLGGPRDELRLLADTFDEMLARLDASFESQGSFIANAGHELRTPLSVVRASVEVVLAKRAPSAAELSAMGDDVRDAVDRAEAILEALLTLARNERGITAAEPVDLATVTQDVLDSLDVGALQIQASLEPGPVLGDTVLIERLITNLVDNAVRYNQPQGQVWISTSVQDGRALLIVANSGPLIPADVVDTLFQPFRRLNTRTSMDGLGLGLALVASIVRAHHGTVVATCRSGGGLEVVVTLPSTGLAEPAAQAQVDLLGNAAR